MATYDNDNNKGVFYGWYVVAALSFSTFFALGARMSFGVFVSAWQDEFAVGVATISVAASVGWLANGFVQPFLGRLTDRIGGRRVIAASIFVIGAGSIAMSLVDSILGLIFLYGIVVSAASGGIAMTPAGAVVSRWFQRRRGTAIGLVAVGGSIGGMVLIPFSAYLLVLTDWRTTWLVLGVIMLAVGLPLVLLVVRSDPSAMGLRPDGGRALTASETTRENRRSTVGPLFVDRWRESFRSRPIWQLSLAYVVCGVTTAIISVHFVRWAQTEGISPGTAALAFGLLSGINAAGVVGIGFISDRMQRKTLLAGVYAVRALAFVALVVLPGSSALWVFAVVGGFSWLATVPLTTALTADVYGLRHLGVLAGLSNLAHQLGGAAAAFLVGLVFDWTGTFDYGFAAGAALLVVASLLALSIREGRLSVRYAPILAGQAAAQRQSA